MANELQSYDQWRGKSELIVVVLEDWKNGKISVEKIQEILESAPGMNQYVPHFKRAMNEGKDVGKALETISNLIRAEEWVMDESQAPKATGLRDSTFGPPAPTA